MFYTSCNMHIQNGKWRGFLEYRDADGKRRKRSKVLSATGKRAARAELEAWRADMEARAELEGGGRGAIRNQAIADYVRAYIAGLEEAKAIEPSTVRSYLVSLKYISEGLEGETVGSIDAGRVAAWESALTRKGFSSSTVIKAHNLLKSALKQAVQRDRAIPHNPVEQVRPPKRSKVHQGVNALDPESRTRLLAALDASALSPMATAAKIALFMGLRVAEVCGLQWRDIDFAAGTMTVERAIGNGKGGEYVKRPKTDRTRKLVIPAELLDSLKAWEQTQEAEFRAQGHTVERGTYVIGDIVGWAHPQLISREWRTLAKLLGLKGSEGRRPTFHDLRHTWATMALSAGMDAVTAALYLGHAKPSMTLDVYAAPAKEAITRAAEITQTAIRGQSQ